MSKNLDQPAHPVTNCQDHEFVGLTLRDQFASQVLGHLIGAAKGTFNVGAPYPETNDNFAMAAYALADAMLRERSK